VAPRIRSASRMLVLPLSFGPIRTVNEPNASWTSRRHLKFWTWRLVSTGSRRIPAERPDWKEPEMRSAQGRTGGVNFAVNHAVMLGNQRARL
jgi:hypothetical protein